MKSRIPALALVVWTSAVAVFAQSPQNPLAMPATFQPTPYVAGEAAASEGIWNDGYWTTLFRTYVALDYVLWWMKPVCLKVPVLTAGSTADSVPGALHQPGTHLLVGASKFEFGGVSGIRPRVGTLLTADGVWAVEAEGFITETAVSRSGFATTAGSPRTFLAYQAPDNSEQALPFSIPGEVNGMVQASGTSRIWGTEANLVVNILGSQLGGVNLQGGVLVGLRYLDLRDHVRIRNTQALVANPAVTATGEDNFTTHNQFYGAQIGSRIIASGPRFSFEAYSKFAAGETLLGSYFDGTPLSGAPVQPGLIPGPIQVLPSNHLAQSTYRVTLAPEVGTKVRFAVSDAATVTLGYSLLYWNRILCPGDLMDTHVNVTQLPFRGPPTGAPVPAIQGVHTDYFLHGLSAGVEWRF
jgi:hypothetical protein